MVGVHGERRAIHLGVRCRRPASDELHHFTPATATCLGFGPAEQSARRAIHMLHALPGVDHHEAIGSGIERRQQQRIGCGLQCTAFERRCHQLGTARAIRSVRLA